MSILNVFVTPDCALMGVDTDATMPDGTTYQVSKMVVVPHLSTVVGFRGLDLMQMAACPVIVGFKGKFDALVDSMSEIIRASVKW